MRLGPPPRPTRVVDLLNPAAVLLPAANVIMQLASPAVGYGVLESPVDSGNVYKHPVQAGPHHRHLPRRGHARHGRGSRADPQ